MTDDTSSKEYKEGMDEARKPAQDEEKDIPKGPSAGTGEESVDTGTDPTDMGNQDDQSHDEDEKDNLPHDDETMSGIPGDTSKSEDETGISLSDDELWDEGDDLDEIPLFEGEEEEKKENDGNETASADEYLAFSLQDEPEEQDKSGNGADQASSEEPESPDAGEHGSGQAKEPDDEHGAETMAQVSLCQWMPWIVIGVSAFLLVLGIVALCAIWPSAENGNRASGSVRTGTPKTETRPVRAAHGLRTGTDVESINFEPFLLPAHQEGELVFLKLHVELIVPDIQTKKNLLLKQTLVRDVIYQELKDITVPAGKGNLLAQYRRPLIRKLNAEFRPLEIKDIRLSGYLLR